MLVEEQWQITETDTNQFKSCFSYGILMLFSCCACPFNRPVAMCVTACSVYHSPFSMNETTIFFCCFLFLNTMNVDVTSGEQRKSRVQQFEEFSSLDFLLCRSAGQFMFFSRFPSMCKNIMLVEHILEKQFFRTSSRNYQKEKKKNPLKLMEGRNLKYFSAHLSSSAFAATLVVVYQSRFFCRWGIFLIAFQSMSKKIEKCSINEPSTASSYSHVSALIALENLTEQTHANYKVHLLRLEKHLDHCLLPASHSMRLFINIHSPICPMRCSLIDYYESKKYLSRYDTRRKKHFTYKSLKITASRAWRSSMWVRGEERIEITNEHKHIKLTIK